MQSLIEITKKNIIKEGICCAIPDKKCITIDAGISIDNQLHKVMSRSLK